MILPKINNGRLIDYSTLCDGKIDLGLVLKLFQQTISKFLVTSFASYTFIIYSKCWMVVHLIYSLQFEFASTILILPLFIPSTKNLLFKS